MSFLDLFKGLFAGNKAAAPAAGAKTTKPANANTTVSRPRNRQVYMGRPTEVPEWAQNITPSELLIEIKKHVVCKYVPNFEMKTIMSAQMGADGNLKAEYNGIAGDCGGVKNFGLKVAQHDGLTAAYKYFDMNLAYCACCGNPRKCPFFLFAESENEAVNARRR